MHGWRQKLCMRWSWPQSRGRLKLALLMTLSLALLELCVLLTHSLVTVSLIKMRIKDVLYFFIPILF